MAQNKNIRFLAATKLGVTRKKYCRFKKSGIRYIDYKNPDFPAEVRERTRQILPAASPVTR